MIFNHTACREEKDIANDLTCFATIESSSGRLLGVKELLQCGSGEATWPGLTGTDHVTGTLPVTGSVPDFLTFPTGDIQADCLLGGRVLLQ